MAKGDKGSRGGKRGAGAQQRNPASYKSAAETQNLAELHDYMTVQHQVWVDYASLQDLDFQSVRTAAGEIEALITEFPQAKGSFDTLQGKRLDPGTLAQASLAGTITLGRTYYMDDRILQSRYSDSVNFGFHPLGTSGANVATHEAGHILEAALIRRNHDMSTIDGRVDGVTAWKKSVYSGKIISEAARNAKKTADGKGKKNSELIADVSDYAKTSRAEALAECVADYRANGANAKPLSREVWKILKRELG